MSTYSCLVRSATLSACFGLLLLAAETLSAAEYRIGHCLGGCPEGADPENQLVVRSTYAMSFDSERATAVWLAYRMRSGALGIASSLSRELLDDADLGIEVEALAGVADDSKVRSSLIPLVSVAGTPYWQEANLVSASVLRSQSLDRGAWSGLEWSLRNVVNRRGEVNVITGPLYSQDQQDYSAPIGFYKLIATADGELSVFRFEQGFAVHVHHCNARSSLEEIEAETGLRFFPEWDRSKLGAASLDAQLGCF